LVAFAQLVVDAAVIEVLGAARVVRHRALTRLLHVTASPQTAWTYQSLQDADFSQYAAA
jgi:hypothetical protein